jgi:hypothetical protein
VDDRARGSPGIVREDLDDVGESITVLHLFASCLWV